MPEKRLARDIVVGIISAAVVAAGVGLWNWMTEGGLIRALGGVTRADLNLVIDPRAGECIKYARQLLLGIKQMIHRPLSQQRGLPRPRADGLNHLIGSEH